MQKESRLLFSFASLEPRWYTHCFVSFSPHAIAFEEFSEHREKLTGFFYVFKNMSKCCKYILVLKSVGRCCGGGLHKKRMGKFFGMSRGKSSLLPLLPPPPLKPIKRRNVMYALQHPFLSLFFSRFDVRTPLEFIRKVETYGGKPCAGEMVGMTQISLLLWPHGKR